METPLVRVETHVGSGLPAVLIVGLPEAVVRESRDRVRAALTTAGFEFPPGRITVNLSPADFPKEGGRFDLPIALGLLVASGQVPPDALGGTEFFGELSLGGELWPLRGALPATLQATRAGHAVVVPFANESESRLVARARVAGATHLTQVTRHLAGTCPLEFLRGARPTDAALAAPDLADVRGQPRARRALEVAAAGGHSLLMIGPPGAGKTMLAARLPGVLPPLGDEEALECATLASIAAGSGATLRFGARPFRAPHHTASAIALVGGGSHPRPGEISLAHHGVLFLDELPEFDRRVLEALREPLETGFVSISRAARQATFPAGFQLVAAMNPCPCGFDGADGRCRCSGAQLRAYHGRLSGPLLERVDLQIDVPRVEYRALRNCSPGEPSRAVAIRVCAARDRQLERAGKLNAALAPAELDGHAPLSVAAERLLALAADRFRLSARACHRVIKVARTIADLGARDALSGADVAEALDARRLDRRAQ